jgi:hypothetical protein
MKFIGLVNLIVLSFHGSAIVHSSPTGRTSQSFIVWGGEMVASIRNIDSGELYAAAQRKLDGIPETSALSGTN